MKRRFRLTRSTDIQRVRRFGKSYAHPLIVLIAIQIGEPENSKFGVTAGRAIGNAVQRNRAKRIIRAALQLHLMNVSPGWQVVLIARRPILDAPFQDVQNALGSLLEKAKILNENHGK